MLSVDKFEPNNSSLGLVIRIEGLAVTQLQLSIAFVVLSSPTTGETRWK